MELIIVFILGMVGAVLVQLSANRDVSRWIRYPLVVLICMIFVSGIAMVVYFAVTLYTEEPFVSVMLWLFALFLLAGAVAYIRNLYHGKRSVNGSEATNDERV